MNKKQQQIAAYAFGVVFVVVMLTIALFVPTPTSFQYLVFRIVLALATAGVAAMIPGFIEVNVPTFLRAGGALAVFAIVFFYNPVALVSNTNSSDQIEPLVPPIKDRTPKQSSDWQGGLPYQFLSAVILPVEARAEDIPAKSESGLQVAQLLEGHSQDDASRIFDLTISNASDTQLLLTTLDVRWRYNHGWLASVDKGAALVPIAKYVIDFPVDTSDENWKTFKQLMSPSIALAPGTTKNPTLVTLRLQLHYHFAGRLNYHPAGDWNILFDIVGVTQTGQRIPIFTDANWRRN